MTFSCFRRFFRSIAMSSWDSILALSFCVQEETSPEAVLICDCMVFLVSSNIYHFINF